MTWSKPLTNDEVEFIRTTYAELGPTECAKRLGRSKSVVKSRAKEMGLTNLEAVTPARVTAEPPSDAGGRQDTLARLREARDVLHLQMLGADPKNVAGIVREYRATCREIEEMEGGEADGGSSLAGALARIISGA